MKKMNTTARKSAPKFIDDIHVLVTKEFAKNAMIFGTSEYKVWREIRKEVPEAEMVTKTIKTNPNKKNTTKNMTYEHMAIYIREQNDADKLMLEFKKQIALSQVQVNPYRSVLAWFMKTFNNYDSYKDYFAKLAEKNAKEKDIFTLVKTSAIIESEDDELNLVSGM